MRFALVLVCVLAAVRAQDEEEEYVPPRLDLPDCVDGFAEKKGAEVFAGMYQLNGDRALMWFCPRPADSGIVVTTCAKVKDAPCTKETVQVGSAAMRMNECAELISQDAFKARVDTCMPWESSMRHFRKQFTTFAPMWKWGEKDHTPQEDRVGMCLSGAEDIKFASKACWHADTEVLWLKPKYKFKQVQSDEKWCKLSNTAVASNVLSYGADRLVYTAQAAHIREVYTQCQHFGIGGWSGNGGLVNALTEKRWLAKDLQFFNYRNERTPTPCPDTVSEACVDNAFSFAAKECVWVKKTKDMPVSLFELLTDRESDLQDIQTYGDKTYVTNVGARNVVVSVRRSDAQPFETWGGEMKIDDLRTASVAVKERPGYSCLGCQGLGQAASPLPANVELSCGVPQRCDTCQAWQFVDVKLAENKCRQPNRECKECPAHHMSAGKDKDTQYECRACPALTPMREKGKGKLECEACQHTQYFDAKSAEGCVFFESVADGLVFTGGTLFNAAYADKYRPPGSARAPEAVPVDHYRNLAADGNAWNASTSAQRCSAVSEFVLNASVAGVLTRNVYGRRLQYRSFCGHVEMIKSGDAMVQALDFVSAAIRLSELVSSGGAYKLERRLVLNRMAEIKRTVGGVDRFYELRREGRTDNCRYCAGTEYTRDCGPTYYAGLAAPSVPGAGTCVLCDETCPEPNSFFAVSEFSCWSNGTQRVRGDATHGSLRGLKAALSTNMNYWYKLAECRACAGLSDAVVPQIVTRCGNKATFETWSDRVEMVLDTKRPQRIVCCVLDSVYPSNDYDAKKLVRCVPEGRKAELTAAGTALCQTGVPDLETSYAPFCPPGWFLDRSAPGCSGVLEKWSNACCSECARCDGAGRLQTTEYRTCPGDTAHDTQLAGCVTTCAEKNYQVGDRCVACESCA